MLSGAPNAWKPENQRTIALYLTKTEYVNLTEAAKEAMFLLTELKLCDWADITNLKIDILGTDKSIPMRFGRVVA